MNKLTPNWHEALVLMISSSRKQAGLTQVALAKRLKWRVSMISKIECRKRRVDVPELIEIALALGIPPDDFLQRIVQWARCVFAWRHGGTPIKEVIAASNRGVE